MQYSEIFFRSKIENFIEKKEDIFAQNMHCGYTLESPRRGGSNELTSTHNVCFGSKIRKLGISLQTPVFSPPEPKAHKVSL